MTRVGRLRTVLLVLLVLVPLVPGHLCALCLECTPAEALTAKAPCHQAPPPPCHGTEQPVHEMQAQSCCDHMAPSPAESERQGLVVPHGSHVAAPAAVSSGPDAAPLRMAATAFRAPDPPPLHTGVSLHTLYSVFLI